MNPKGVVFGANAKLDVSGSFAVTTANYLKLSDGGRFNASLGGQDSLTAAPVSAFGFLSATPAAVTFTGSRVTAKPGAAQFLETRSHPEMAARARQRGKGKVRAR